PDDVLVPCFHFSSTQAQNGSVQEHVLPSRELRIEAASQLEQGCHAPLHLHGAFSRSQRTCEDLQQRALAAAVSSDDSQRLAGAYFQRYAAQCPELAAIGTSAQPQHLLQPILWSLVDAVHL